MKLVDLVRPECVIPELASTDKTGVIRELTEALAAAGVIDAAMTAGIVKSITVRERTKGTTAFGKGVAAPHAKVAGLEQPVAALGVSPAGVDFAALDGEAVFGVVLLLSPEERPELHLEAMNVVFGHLQRDRFRKFLRQCRSARAVYELLQEADGVTVPE